MPSCTSLYEKLEYCMVFLKSPVGLLRGGCGHALQRGESTFSEGATQGGGARTGIESICCSLDGWKQLRGQATVPGLAWTLPEMRKRPSFGESLRLQNCVRRAILSPGLVKVSAQRSQTTENRDSGSSFARQWAVRCREYADQRNFSYAVAVVRGGHSLVSRTFGNDPP